MLYDFARARLQSPMELSFENTIRFAPGPAIALYACLLMLLVVPVFCSIVRNTIAKGLLIILPCPLIALLFMVWTGLYKTQAFGSLPFILLAIFVWYLIGFKPIQQAKTLFRRIMMIVVFAGPLLVGQWIAWGVTVEMMMGIATDELEHASQKKRRAADKG